MTGDAQHVATYPTETQYARWKARADDLGVSCSQFIQDMIEAGMKAEQGFDTDVTPDETTRQLREQRNQLKTELDGARARIETLEEQAFYGERRAIRRYVEENPGVTTNELIKYMERTASDRVIRYLSMESGNIVGDLDADGNDGWYPAEGDV